MCARVSGIGHQLINRGHRDFQFIFPCIIPKKKPAPQSSSTGSCQQGGLELLDFGVPALAAQVVTWVVTQSGNPEKKFCR